MSKRGADFHRPMDADEFARSLEFRLGGLDHVNVYRAGEAARIDCVVGIVGRYRSGVALGQARMNAWKSGRMARVLMEDLRGKIAAQG